jgi:hypothetical protein
MTASGSKARPMLEILLNALAIAAILLGIAGSLALVTLLLASGANASPHDLVVLKRWLLVIAVGGVGVVALGIWLIVGGRPWWAAAVGSLPMTALLGLIAWVEFTRSR